MLKIIFMGTPEFSCPTLKKLIADSEFQVVAVYTREPQIAGRGQKLQNSPIHNLALASGIKVVTPKTLRDAAVQKEFLDFGADAAVVVAYGLLLPPEILQATKFGCVNIHPSLLPRWRGAAPIQRAIMSGDSETGVNIIQMDKGLDSGDLLAEEKFLLGGSETYGALAEKMSEIGAELLVKTLKKLRDGNVVATMQDHASALYAKKIEKSECEINWENSAEEIERKIRGLSGSLGAFFHYAGEKIKIFSAEILDKNSQENEAGKILSEDFLIQCGKGIIRPLVLQRQGKKAMAVEEFLRGFKINQIKLLRAE